jgi:hypothetical protein
MGDFRPEKKNLNILASSQPACSFILEEQENFFLFHFHLSMASEKHSMNCKVAFLPFVPSSGMRKIVEKDEKSQVFLQGKNTSLKVYLLPLLVPPVSFLDFFSLTDIKIFFR